MDLSAYMQIDDLSQIAKENNIKVPRLRGYRLMKNEKPVSAEEINQIIKECEIEVCEDLCRSVPFWCEKSCGQLLNSRTDFLCRYYLVEGVDENGRKKFTNIRWDRIHGKKRKVLKFAIKKKKKRIQRQFEIWNKYAGQDKILYIHSRTGGNNWDYYGGSELSKMPWFLEKVDDWFDRTYCDIYASIK